MSSSSAWRRIVSVRCVTIDRLGVDDRVAERLGLGARAVLDPDGGQAEGGLGGRDAGEAWPTASPGFIASRWPGTIAAARDLGAAHLERRTRATRAPRRRGCGPAAMTMPSSRGDLAADDADAREQRAARRCRRAGRGRSRSRARAGRPRARRGRRRRARRASGLGAAAGAAGGLCRLGGWPVCAARGRARKIRPPTRRNGIFGRPGTSANAQMTPPATIGALRLAADLAGDVAAEVLRRWPSA